MISPIKERTPKTLPLDTIDADDYDVTAFLDSAYLDHGGGGNGNDIIEEGTDTFYTDSDGDDTDLRKANMFRGTHRANSSSAQELIDSLLNFSDDGMATHVEMHSPRLSDE